MASESVSLWIDQLKAGDHDAAQMLWQRYFHRLIGLAQKRLSGRARLGADAEDVALSAFDSFFRAAEAGRFPKLQDREDLWHILVTITVRKALHLVRDELRDKRGGGSVVGESHLGLRESDGRAGGMELLIDDEPDPGIAAQLTEVCDRLFELLPEEELRTVAKMRLEGFTVAEIAGTIGRAVSSVERKLRVIREVWNRELIE